MLRSELLNCHRRLWKRVNKRLFFRKIFVCFSSLRLMARFLLHTHTISSFIFFLWATSVKDKLSSLMGNDKNNKNLTYVSTLFISLLFTDERIVWKFDFQMNENFSFFSWFFYPKIVSFSCNPSEKRRRKIIKEWFTEETFCTNFWWNFYHQFR